MEHVERLQEEMVGSRERILVTGASGFVGGKIMQRLAAYGIPVLGTDVSIAHKFDYYTPLIETRIMDLTKKDDLKRVFSEFTIKYIIHTAALFKFNAPYELLKLVNVDGTKNLVEQAINHGQTKGIIHFSTAMVYGKNVDGIPLNEDAPLSPGNAYGQSKYESELIVGEFKRDIKIIMVRPTAIYGRGSHYGLRKIVDVFANDFPVLPLPYKGQIRSSIVHVRDVAGGAIHLLANLNDLKYDVYNIADEYPITISEAFKVIKDNMYSSTFLLKIPENASDLMRKMLNYIPGSIEVPLPNIVRWNIPTKLERDDFNSLFYENIFDISRLKESGYELIYPTFYDGFTATLNHYIALNELPQHTIDRIKAQRE